MTRFSGTCTALHSTRQAPLIYCLAFVGGFVIMSLELLGGRVQAPYFGGSIYVWGSIISVFMLSLAVGYLLGGQLSVRIVSMRVFATIFFAAAVTLYPLIYHADTLMTLVFDAIEDPRYGSLVSSAILFVVPTVILGMISPYSVRLLVQTTETTGRVAGTLYFVSTMGSALGTLGTSFYFVAWFELTTILLGLTGALLVMSMIGWFAPVVPPRAATARA